jgi:hypothetical protein
VGAPAPWESDPVVDDDEPWAKDPVIGESALSAPADEPSFWSQLASVPAAYRDVVLAQIKSGDLSALTVPGAAPVAREFLAAHPTIAKVAGGVGGAVLGTPGGIPGMVAGGALGAAGADSYSQIAQHAAGPESLTAAENPAPATSAEAASRAGWAGAGGALTGAMMGGGVAGAPPLLRAAASPVGAGVIAAGTGVASGQSPRAAAAEGLATAAGLRMVPGAAGLLAKGAGKAASAVESLALRSRLSHLIKREAPEAAAAAVKATTSGTTAPMVMPAAGTSMAAPVAPSAATSSFGSFTAPVRGVVTVQPAAAPAATQAAPAAAQITNPAQIAPGGWREVGISNWYGTKGGPTEAEWAKMGGAKAHRAWLESRNLIPGANTAQDVAAAVARGVPPEQIQKLYGTARQPAAAPRPDLKPPKVRAGDAKLARVRAAQETAADPAAAPAAKARAAHVLANPDSQATALADDIARKVVALHEQGLSAAQIAASLRDTHGIPASSAKKMVNMIMSAAGAQ